MTPIQETREGKRLAENQQEQGGWKHWGPYLSDRQWGTVREDYSPDGTAWDYFPHDHARSRAYRWGEDGIAGICDGEQNLCFAITLWNGQDDILKERLFGLTNSEGNHGEDVKEYYFYLDNTPTHAYMKCLYKYPQARFPYTDLVNENARRKADPASFEYELLDTGVFKDKRYFDVFVEYAKNTPEDLLVQIQVVNRGPDSATLHLLPTLWFRNTWSWLEDATKASLHEKTIVNADYQIIEAHADDQSIAPMWLYCEGAQQVWYTENETNRARFGWGANPSPYVKDSFEQYLLYGQKNAINANKVGTKAAPYYKLDIAAGATSTIRLRLSSTDALDAPFNAQFTQIVQTRQQEADEFYQAVTPFEQDQDKCNIQRQALAGMLWNKQFYNYAVKRWLDGDPTQPAPPEQRMLGRNHDWQHLFLKDVISMPDTWEYPWFASWDLAFHTIPLALIDPAFAKQQILLLLQAWSMHPNGQVPAYEWSFDDLNPPVQAWAAWRVYKIEEKRYGNADRSFLAQVFQKLSLYFNWWLNRKDIAGNDIFQGGFLGLDNIGPFDRSNIPSSISGHIDQSDATGWMGMFSLNMLRIAVELANQDQTYEQMAIQYYLQFLYIAQAMNQMGPDGEDLWDENDGFYYDVLHLTDGHSINGQTHITIKLRSAVGLIPLLAVEAIDLQFLQSEHLAEFKKRFTQLLQESPYLTQHANVVVQDIDNAHMQGGALLALVQPERLKRILEKLLSEQEFLSPRGIRSVSKYYAEHPYILPGIYDQQGRPYTVTYAPAESRTGDFGGNSNWRGPVWFPINFLLIEALQKFHFYLPDDFKVECPVGSGKMLTLEEVATELSSRLISIFQQSTDQKRPLYGGIETFQTDPNWMDLIMFHEYFHGDNGAGLGASHQTGWTGVVAKLIQQLSEYSSPAK